MSNNNEGVVPRDEEIVPVSADPHIEWDQRDYQLIRAALDERKKMNNPLVGDYVVFTDGVIRRISFIWPHWVLTSDSGIYHFGKKGYMHWNGPSFYRGIPPKTLTDTGTTRPADAWMGHHRCQYDWDWARAQPADAVYFQVPVRVYNCSLPSNK